MLVNVCFLSMYMHIFEIKIKKKNDTKKKLEYRTPTLFVIIALQELIIPLKIA